MDQDDSSSGKKPDVVLVHGRTEDQKGLRVLRARESGIEVGEVRPLEEGKPIDGDVVKLVPRADAPYLCDVETQVSLDELRKKSAALRGGASGGGGPSRTDVATTRKKSGPAQVATDAYRANWDAIWSRPRGGSNQPN